jgi:hypothetical protein
MTKQNFEQDLSNKICADVAEIINDQWTRSLNETLSSHTNEVTTKVNEIVSKYDNALDNLRRSYYALKVSLVIIASFIVVGFTILIIRDVRKDVKIDRISEFTEKLGAPVMTERGLKFFPKDFMGDTIPKR